MAKNYKLIIFVLYRFSFKSRWSRKSGCCVLSVDRSQIHIFCILNYTWNKRKWYFFSMILYMIFWAHFIQFIYLSCQLFEQFHRFKLNLFIIEHHELHLHIFASVLSMDWMLVKKNISFYPNLKRKEEIMSYQL